MDVVVELARPGEVEALVRLRDAIAKWLTERGIEQWLPGEFPPDRMRDWIDQQAVHVVRRDGRPIASVAVLWEDPDIWGEEDRRAGYVHLLMVDRGHGGQGLGDHMLAHAEQEIRRHDRSRVRLDAVASNRRLVAWYRDRGYEPVGTRTFPATTWCDTTLLEKPLSATRNLAAVSSQISPSRCSHSGTSVKDNSRAPSPAGGASPTSAPDRN